MADGLNPQQMLFKEAYCNPNSPTFSNALQSGLAAGYSQEYSESIGNQGYVWYSEMLRDLKRLQSAEKVLDEVLTKPLEDPNMINAVTRVAIFVAEGLGKQKYSKRNEHTGPDGKELPTPIYGGISVQKEVEETPSSGE